MRYDVINIGAGSAGSVMPDVIRADTNATTIVIAECVADWITAGQ